MKHMIFINICIWLFLWHAKEEMKRSRDRFTSLKYKNKRTETNKWYCSFHLSLFEYDFELGRTGARLCASWNCLLHCISTTRENDKVIHNKHYSVLCFTVRILMGCLKNNPATKNSLAWIHTTTTTSLPELESKSIQIFLAGSAFFLPKHLE